MNVAADSLFLSHPDPMWIYELDTLGFLAVNNAALAKYGYSRDEFLAMTIADIRPVEDRIALEKNVQAVTEGLDEAGVWRHRLKSGDLIYVDITGHTLDYDGRRAELISARDVSRFVVAERTVSEALAREEAARRSSEALTRQFQIMFDSVPGMFLVFSPESFDVIAVSDAFLSSVDLARHDVVGHKLFKALPQQPQDRTHRTLRASFDRVVASGKPDLLEFQSFWLPRDGERYWAVSCTPVIGPDQRLLHLILRMQDVTDAIEAGSVNSTGQHDQPSETATIDLVAHTRKLKADNLHLAELATRLRTTQRLLGTGTWDYVISKDLLEWSDNVYGMYGTTAAEFGHGFEDYVALVHPDDRTAMRANFDAFVASGDTFFTFAHRITHANGLVVHVHGVAEKTTSTEGPCLRGVVQDVTETVVAEKALAEAKRMLEIAGTSAKFGAWRFDAQTELLEWSSQTARIHDEPAEFSPTVTDGMNYYIPEHRDRIARLFQSCLKEGEPFDDTFQIITAKGRQRSVRSTGEAERDETGRIIALHGSIQDVSELAMVRERADESERLLEIAGRAVKLGGWRVSLTDQNVSWTDGVAAIHELPPGSRPTYEGGIDYFAPEEQESARKVFEACAEHGIPFDNVRDLITAKGNRIRIRSIGVPVRDNEDRIVAVEGAMQDISELAAAQRKAGELSRRLAETFENIGDAFYMLGEDWRFNYVNGKAEVLLERTRDGLLGRNIFDEFPEIAGSELQAQYIGAFETGQTARFEHYFAELERAFRVNAHPTPSGLAVYFSDITESRRQDEQIRLLDAAVAQINDIVIITKTTSGDTAGDAKIVYVNDAFERITGFTKDEAIGQTPRILQGPKTQRSELDRIHEAVIALEPVRAELINYTKSGREYWLELDIVPLADKAGLTTHFVAVQREITERRRAEEALRLSEARFRLVAQATGNGIWEWDVVRERLWWSDGMSEIFGYQTDPEGVPREAWHANLHPGDKTRVEESFDRLLSGEINMIQDHYRFRRANGTWAHVEDRALLIQDDDGRAVRILGSITDITEKLAVEDRLRQSQKLEAVGQLTGGVAHDFNNLLTIIIGSTEMLLDELDDGHPLRKYADMSALAADRAAELISRLLAFSRQQALQPRAIDVNTVIDGFEKLLLRTLGEDVEIEIVLAGDLWPTEIDVAQLEAALLNLAINSRDAMPQGGTLIIETANVSLDDDYVSTELGLSPGHYILITVSDTGHGIAKEQIDRVFEPFFTTKAVGKGTGLGLSMVYGFVKQTGGSVRVYSEPGQGTTIKLYFPRLSGDRVTSHPESDSENLVQGQETILVVEDDNLILQQIATQLIGLGYKVVTASSGAPALEILRERSDIDLLFTDVILPGGLNGQEIAEAAQLIQPGIKVLFTSGYSENAIVRHGRLDQGVDLLSKPYKQSELASMVRKVLGL